MRKIDWFVGYELCFYSNRCALKPAIEIHFVKSRNIKTWSSLLIIRTKATVENVVRIKLHKPVKEIWILRL